MVDIAQSSFSRGEIDPALHSRKDLDGYRTGLSTLRNMVVMRSGGVQNRAGFKFVAPTKFATTSGSSVRVIPFIFNSDDGNTYAIEVGDLYLRFYKNGAQIRKTAANISGITKANPGVITTGAAHGLVAGEEFYVSGVVGMKEVNGRWFKAGTVGGGGTTVQLLDRDGNNINTTNYGTYVSGGTTEEVYEVTTTYDEDDVFRLKYSQINDVMYLTHPSYPVKTLVRSADTSWSFGTLVTSNVVAPRTCAGSAGGAGSNTYRYKVVAVFPESLGGGESLPGTEAGKVITGITQANPAVVTTSGAHGYTSGDIVRINDVAGMTEVNNREYTISVLSGTTFSLLGIDSSAYTAYSSGGAVGRTSIVISSAAAPTTSAPHVLTWIYPRELNLSVLVAGVTEYVIFKEHAGVYGFIGISKSLTFSDTGLVPDISDTPLVYRDLFNSANNYPSCSAPYQGRLCFGNSNNEPGRVWTSAVGEFSRFDEHQEQHESDPVTFDVAGSKALQIRSMHDLGRLVLFTSEGEYIEKSDVLTPFDIEVTQASANGSANLQALLVNSSALYVQGRSSMVRDLIKTPVQIDGYDGDERSIWSAHLFRGYTITDSAYQQVPDSIAYFVRSDGDVNALTYVREQSMFGWHRHDTQGTIESICTVPEGTEDALYAVISRTVNGSSQRYIERLNTRHIGPDSDDVEDNVFVDSSKSFDGRNTGSTTMTLSTGTVWTAGTTLTITASSSYFNADMVGDKINVTDSAGTVAHCLITASTSATVMSVTSDIDIPVVMQNAARTTWGRARKILPELWHLEGLSVSCQGDSFVESNPNNSTLTKRTVSGGSVTFGRWYEVLHIGLPYVSDLKTLPIDTADPFQNLTANMKLITAVMAQVYRSRGIYAGESLPSSDSSLTGLREMLPLSASQSYDSTPSLTTETKEVNITAAWNTGGTVVIRQVDPLPCAILSIVPRGHIVPRSR